MDKKLLLLMNGMGLLRFMNTIFMIDRGTINSYLIKFSNGLIKVFFMGGDEWAHLTLKQAKSLRDWLDDAIEEIEKRAPSLKE